MSNWRWANIPRTDFSEDWFIEVIDDDGREFIEAWKTTGYDRLTPPVILNRFEEAWKRIHAASKVDLPSWREVWNWKGKPCSGGWSWDESCRNSGD